MWRRRLAAELNAALHECTRLTAELERKLAECAELKKQLESHQPKPLDITWTPPVTTGTYNMPPSFFISGSNWMGT